MKGNTPKKNTTHGGKREGAGRKERPQGSSNHTLWLPDKQWAAIEPDKTGYHSRNQFVIDAIQEKLDRD